MPCYDGETLRRLLDRGPLPVDQAVDIAAQIARGLAKAHGNGIVHRDVKPANLIVTADGVVKILDFGLAKLAGLAAVSRTGSSAGTPAYMSPEQARGGEVDARTDLWSLGVVLYEMLAGRRPFGGEREQAVIYSILHETAQPLRELRPEVPPELARIVERLMAKRPEDRYPSIEEPLAGLRALVGATGTTGVPVLASPRRKTGLWLGMAAAVALMAATYLLARGRGDRPLQLSFAQLTDQEGSENFPSCQGKTQPPPDCHGKTDCGKSLIPSCGTATIDCGSERPKHDDRSERRAADATLALLRQQLRETLASPQG